jgi:RNA polymerase sigma factor (sigma-70 family)
MPSADTRALYDLARRGSPEDVNAFYERCARKLLPLIRLGSGERSGARWNRVTFFRSCSASHSADWTTSRNRRPSCRWLARIAENEIRDQADYYKRRGGMRRCVRRFEDAADVPAPIRHALSQAIVSRQTEALEAALEELDEAQREIIVLRKARGADVPEIARRLGKSEDACRMAFSRAMAALTLKLAGPQGLQLRNSDGR